MAEELPQTREDTYGLAPGVQDLYEYNDRRGTYRLTPGGSVLSSVRNSLLDGPAGGRVRISADVDLRDWTRTLAVATQAERKELLKLAANGKIKIRR